MSDIQIEQLQEAMELGAIRERQRIIQRLQELRIQNYVPDPDGTYSKVTLAAATMIAQAISIVEGETND